MNDLERRYRWLLNIYPRPYREYRLDEMLETLLATADEHQRRPSLREAASLVVGGLRARTGADRLRSPWRCATPRCGCPPWPCSCTA